MWRFHRRQWCIRFNLFLDRLKSQALFADLSPKSVKLSLRNDDPVSTRFDWISVEPRKASVLHIEPANATLQQWKSNYESRSFTVFQSHLREYLIPERHDGKCRATNNHAPLRIISLKNRLKEKIIFQLMESKEIDRIRLILWDK